MQPPLNHSVPNWIRCVICLTACLSMLGLIYAVCMRIDVGYPLPVAIAGFAGAVAHLAFRDST